MDWLELSFTVEGSQIEALYAALDGIAPGGCSIEDPVEILGPEEGVRPLPGQPSVLRIYLPEDALAQARGTAARAAAAALQPPVRLSERRVREEDWANGWKEFFQVERVGRKLIIQPTWRSYQPLPDDVVLHLDPGMAFGTGQHETTRMCLQALEELPLDGAHVLDLGCGSGILGIAALKLGAARVTALDLESVAIEATGANAARNGVGAALRVAAGSLGDRWAFGESPDGTFDIVVANIHAAALIELAPAIHAALRPGGALVGSGVIGERLAAVQAALQAAGFGRIEVRAAGEWRCVVAFAAAAATP